MQQNGYDNKNFTVQDIERYYSGQMTAQEMYLLEKAALDDPFLADALEGYAITKTPVNDVAELQDRLNEKTRRKTIPIIWWNKGFLKIAATILLVVAGGGIIYYLAQLPNQNIAKRDFKEPEKNLSADTVATPIETNDSALIVNTKEEAKTNTETFKSNYTKEDKKEAARIKDAKQAEAIVTAKAKQEDAVATMEIQAMKESEDTELASRTRARLAAPMQSMKKAADTIIANAFRGRVLDNNNNPIPFATVINKKTQSATVTDLNGNFQISADDSTINVNIQSVGYNTVAAILKKEDANAITLKPTSNSLSEVEVTGFGVRSDNDYELKEQLFIELNNAKPVNGLQNLNNYIKDEITTLKANGFKEKGKVKLLFDVDKEGSAINIEVKKSDCDKCIEEAKRMIQQAPKLKQKNNRKKIKATIYF